MSRELSSTQIIFTEKQIHQIISKYLGERRAGGWQVIACDRQPASAGLAGFLGDHSRVTLHVKSDGLVKKIRLFVKTMPASNAPKAQFIDTNCYFKREAVALRLAEEMRGAEGPTPWTVRAYLCNERMVVMPDMAAQGYRTLHYCETLSLPHALLAAAALARFHAAFANYTAARTARDQSPYNFLQEYGNIMTEPTFCDSRPVLKAIAFKAPEDVCAELDSCPRRAGATSLNCKHSLFHSIHSRNSRTQAHTCRTNTFSNKFKQYPPNLEQRLAQRYLEACNTLAEHEGTLNVMLHKDMWVNNIMYKYEGDMPTNALLIDFQCLRYGPPAFDLMVFLYLTTEREFRERHEGEIIRHYFTVFSENLDEKTKLGLKVLKYDMEELVRWCEKSRMFGMFMALGIFPYVLMEPLAAQQTFDEAATFLRYCNEDRSGPVLAHCRRDPDYLRRQLHLTEEFVERYLIQNTKTL
ncbi:PREDICTED: uncharacterized protein LOC106119592 [Papilio xuthus]|uniref:Uncharacterized protein LOC106119592 n=1 Tax=Papilio xuthus TaxID=66420 RepID=A0AAJ7EB43_PAPXU|nr:PREDICTED: uncharacterized protein LOC106119592 [Papilio xuthus]